MRELALRIARKNAFLTFSFDGWGTLAADRRGIYFKYIRSTWRRRHTHIYTHCTYVQHSPRKEGIAFGSPPQGYCCSWPPPYPPQRFRHLMSRPQYAIKTPRMRRPPDRQQTSDQRPSYPQEYQSQEIEMAKTSLLGCCICSPDQILLFTSRYALFQWHIRLRLASSFFPVPYILSNSYLGRMKCEGSCQRASC